jgi:hypothetical protein
LQNEEHSRSDNAIQQPRFGWIIEQFSRALLNEDAILDTRPGKNAPVRTLVVIDLDVIFLFILSDLE